MSDKIHFECEDEEFCLLLSHPRDCSPIDDEKMNTKQDNSNHTMFIKTMGYKRCEFIACGYLRRNSVNPKDISTIIAKYFTQHSKISLNICNNHHRRMILFPSMKKVHINFSKMFNKNENNGCYLCTNNIIVFQCGIIGIPQMHMDKEKNEKSEKINNNDIYNSNRKPLKDCNNYNDNCKVNSNIKTFYKLLSDYNDHDEIVANDSHFTFGQLKDHRLAMNNSIKNKHFKRNKKLIDDMQIIFCNIVRAGARDKLVHWVAYRDRAEVTDTCVGITRHSAKHLHNNNFRFKNGDFVVLEYDKDTNSFLIETHCNKNKMEKTEMTRNMNDNINCVRLTDSTKIRKDSPIAVKNNKLILKNGYDYLLACCISGCDRRSPGMNNVYTFSGKHQDCL